MSNESSPSLDGIKVVIDARSRKLSVKQPDFLQESRITKLCGEASTNVGYMYAYVFPAVSVVAIDGDAVPFPVTYREVEALIARVGREGCSAVLDHMKQQQDDVEHQQEVKN